MSFTFASMFETPEDEVARLASAPEGSKLQALSTLPVLTPYLNKGMLIELPLRELNSTEGRVVVVCVADRGQSSRQPTGQPLRRHSSWWHVLVVASDDRRYPVGGHDLNVPACELVRGKLVELCPSEG